MKIIGCDNQEDAIYSLKLIYNCSENKIIENINSNVHTIINKSLYEGLSTYDAISKINKIIGNNKIIKSHYAKFYHITSYDGNPEWFSDGLLNSTEGAIRFIEKIRDAFPISAIEFNQFKESIKTMIDLRTQNEGCIINSGGPYCYEVFDYAKKHFSGYTIPEIIINKLKNRKQKDIITVYIKQHLRPVIIKFKHNQYDCINYTFNLWNYLCRVNFSKETAMDMHFKSCIENMGKSIKRENILGLFEIENTNQ